ncbi:MULTISPECIES: hypothetical protein [Bacilli]|uniref:Uncharacterized protein n=7 Tax=Bacilli TaxID=91061 RepID=A0A896TDR7_LACLC|nr:MULTISPECIES: hypothetical protein [Bacilli]KUL06000.1 hypothetical protein LI17339_22010 [Bacillus licheniformis LMG 17339]KZK52311.1 hypothetical protein AM2_2083 [Lactococcus cremoris]MCT4408661.1 hypothetical protein [Lactococcus cremoris]MRM44697.1 hypothetical protein [Lactococcus cremoris]QSD64209.1 hypothetical protein LL1196_03985 [Lactococcus cremoris]
MKKTYFMRTFNLNLRLVLFSISTFIITVFLDFMSASFEKSSLLPLFKLSNSISAFSNFTFELSVGLLSLVTLLTTLELIKRFKSDSWINYFKSIKQTFNLRRFMRQSERSGKIVETQKVTIFNPINEKFNRAVRKSCIDVKNGEILVFIKIPSTQQTQKILKELEAQIKEEISNQNPEYIFSNFERHRNQLWLQGTKRK